MKYDKHHKIFIKRKINNYMKYKNKSPNESDIFFLFIEILNELKPTGYQLKIDTIF